MDSNDPITDDDVMSPEDASKTTPIFSKAGGATIAAFAISAVLLLGIFLIATAWPIVGFASLCLGVVVKGTTGVMEALMKTEDENYWRPEVRKSIAQMNVVAVILAFPPLLTVAAEKLFGVLPS